MYARSTVDSFTTGMNVIAIDKFIHHGQWREFSADFVQENYNHVP